MKNLYDANSLYRAFLAAQKASPMKPQTQRYAMDWLHNIALLYDSLQNGTYTPSGKSQFIINERGKTRLIRAAPLKDKIVQHALCDDVLLPAVRPKLIYDNYASLENRGVTMARKRFEIMLHRYYREHRSNEGYILLMDFSGYYDNLRHDLVYKMMRELIDSNDSISLWLLREMIKCCRKDVSFLSPNEVEALFHGKYKALDYIGISEEQLTGERFLYKGLDIGDQVAQIAAVYFPTVIDNFIKIVLGEKYYGRYMDDSLLLGETVEHLVGVLAKVKVIADKCGLILNPKKVKIIPLGKTFQYLQIKYSLTPTGAVIKRINPKRVTTMRRKLKKLAVMVKNGKRDYLSVRNMFKGWAASYYKIMSKVQRQNMDDLFNSLFEKEESEYENALQIRPEYRQIYWCGAC